LARGAFAFAGAIAQAIPRFKYQDKPFLAEALTELAWPRWREWVGSAEVVAPVPLHAQRLRERGYDQALLLAKELARRSNLSLGVRLAERIRATSTQVGSSVHERAQNLRGAFAAKAEEVQGRSVLLVDDVITTGATIREVAKALSDAGAKEVRVLAVARAF
jgi:ComF family protein